MTSTLAHIIEQYLGQVGQTLPPLLSHGGYEIPLGDGLAVHVLQQGEELLLVASPSRLSDEGAAALDDDDDGAYSESDWAGRARTAARAPGEPRAEASQMEFEVPSAHGRLKLRVHQPEAGELVMLTLACPASEASPDLLANWLDDFRSVYGAWERELEQSIAADRSSDPAFDCV